jgi:hypothetical protein
MAVFIRRFHKEAVRVYESLNGELLHDEFYLLRKTNTGVVLIKALRTTNPNIFHIRDQVLYSPEKKMYRNSEVINQGDSDG